MRREDAPVTKGLANQPGAKARQRAARRSLAWQYRDLYLLIAVPLASLIVFQYLPMFGIVLAFQNYKLFDGILGSQWVGLAHFQRMLSDPKFFQIFSNTVIINLLKFVFQFPIPILLALMLNEVRVALLKRGVQTLIYLPHFLSWVVVSGIFYDILGRGGLVNAALGLLGLPPENFLANSKYFRGLLVMTTAWKESGWSTIVYLSAMTAIDPNLYEAASVDGAGRLRQALSITLPGIVTTIAFIVILRASAIVGSDTEQVLMFYKPIVYSVGDVIGTYVYREGVINSKFSYTTAVGLFSSVVGMAMLLISNRISRRYTGKGIW